MNNTLYSSTGTDTELELKTFSQTRIVLGSQHKVQSSHIPCPYLPCPQLSHCGQPDDSSGTL